jgi:hypothetical protein
LLAGYNHGATAKRKLGPVVSYSQPFYKSEGATKPIHRFAHTRVRQHRDDNAGRHGSISFHCVVIRISSLQPQVFLLVMIEIVKTAVFRPHILCHVANSMMATSVSPHSCCDKLTAISEIVDSHQWLTFIGDAPQRSKRNWTRGFVGDGGVASSKSVHASNWRKPTHSAIEIIRAGENNCHSKLSSPPSG